MEKRVAHYSMDSIKELIRQQKYFVTNSARMGYIELGLEDEDALGVVLSLTPKNFYKSMTSHHDSKVWQDVYHSSFGNIQLYIKLQVVENAIIIAFKEK